MMNSIAVEYEQAIRPYRVPDVDIPVFAIDVFMFNLYIMFNLFGLLARLA